MCEAYGGGLMGHFRVAKTLDVLFEHFFCQRWKEVCNEYVNNALHIEKKNLKYNHIDCKHHCLYLLYLGQISL